MDITLPGGDFPPPPEDLENVEKDGSITINVTDEAGNSISEELTFETSKSSQNLTPRNISTKTLPRELRLFNSSANSGKPEFLRTILNFDKKFCFTHKKFLYLRQKSRANCTGGILWFSQAVISV